MTPNATLGHMHVIHRHRRNRHLTASRYHTRYHTRYNNRTKTRCNSRTDRPQTDHTDPLA